MTEEEKREFEEFLEWKRAKQAEKERQEAALKTSDEAKDAAPLSDNYSKDENTPKPAPVDSPKQDDAKMSRSSETWLLAILAVIAGVVVLLACIVNCNGGASSPAVANNESMAIEEESVLVVDTLCAPVSMEPASAWKYFDEVDEMTDKTAYFASVTSDDAAYFDFPYEGGSYLTLTVRKSPKFGNDVYIRISKGQFKTAYDGTTIKVRFDDEPQFSVSCNEASDGSSDILFLNGFNKLVGKLKTHKTMKVNAEFYQEGNHTFTFDIENFEWAH